MSTRSGFGRLFATAGTLVSEEAARSPRQCSAPLRIHARVAQRHSERWTPARQQRDLSALGAPPRPGQLRFPRLLKMCNSFTSNPLPHCFSCLPCELCPQHIGSRARMRKRRHSIGQQFKTNNPGPKAEGREGVPRLFSARDVTRGARLCWIKDRESPPPFNWFGRAGNFRLLNGRGRGPKISSPPVGGRRKRGVGFWALARGRGGPKEPAFWNFFFGGPFVFPPPGPLCATGP